MSQKAIERDAYYYATDAQKKTIKKLRGQGWDINGRASEVILMGNLLTRKEAAIASDGKVYNSLFEIPGHQVGN